MRTITIIKAIQKNCPDQQFVLAGKYPDFDLSWYETNTMPEPSREQIIEWAENYVEVPFSITPRQARLILNQYNLRETVETAIANADQNTKDEWEFSDHIRRDWPSLISIASGIGITESQLDQMFIEASEL